MCLLHISLATNIPATHIQTCNIGSASHWHHYKPYTQLHCYTDIHATSTGVSGHLWAGVSRTPLQQRISSAPTSWPAALHCTRRGHCASLANIVVTGKKIPSSLWSSIKSAAASVSYYPYLHEWEVCKYASAPLVASVPTTSQAERLGWRLWTTVATHQAKFLSTILDRTNPIFLSH